MPLLRFDSRSQTVLKEANAIGRAYLRTELLPEAQRRTAKNRLAAYVQLRIEGSKLDLTQEETRRCMQQDVAAAQDAVRAVVLEAAGEDPRIVLVIFIIIDLDLPRRGLIEVSQKSMLDLLGAVAPPGAE